MSRCAPAGAPRFWGRGVAAIAGAGLALRVGYVWAAKRDQPLLGDQIYYALQAQVLAAGRGFVHPVFGGPAADHPPLTALLMAPVALLTDSITAQRMAMAVLGAGVVVLVGYLGHLLAGRRAGLVAATIAAAYPNLWVNDALVMSDTATAGLVALLLITVLRWREAPSVRRAALVGTAVGLGTLARAELPLLALLVVVPAMLRRPSLAPSDRLRSLAAAGAVAIGLVAPWVLPNLVRFDRPVLLSTNDGLTLVGANCESTYFGGGLGFWDLRCAPPVAGDESVQAARYRTMAIDYVTDHAGRVPTVVAARVARVWGLYRPFDMVFLNQGEGREPWVSRLCTWSWWALAPLGAAGAVVLRRRRRPVWPLLAPAVAVTITAAAFYGITRFRVPAEVATVALAAVALDALSRRAGAAAAPG